MKLTSYPKELKKNSLRHFRSLLLTAGNAEESYMIIKSLFTSEERYAIGRRLEIAEMLIKGEKYEDIKIKLKTSNITITRVSRMVDKNIISLGLE